MAALCEPLFISTPCGGVPNNALPLLRYVQVLPAHAGDPAAWFEQRFDTHGWAPRWRYPVFTWTHFHSNTHEVLGIFQGEARLQLGGEEGVTLVVKHGDAILIPAGVGHKQLSATRDFMATGAYPAGFTPDTFVDEIEHLAKARQNVAKVSLPETDPLYGKEGGLAALWHPSGSD